MVPHTFCSFFIFFDLTHIESRISPNIKILFCWTQILSCCPVTSIPCIFLAFEIYQWPRTLPPQYKKMNEEWQHGEYKIPTYKIWQLVCRQYWLLGKSSIRPPLPYSLYHSLEFNLHVFQVWVKSSSAPLQF